MKLRDNNLLILSCLWAIPCLFFVIAPSYDTNYLFVLFPFITTLFLAVYDKKYLVYAIPYITLISPLIGANNPFFALPSEIFLFVIFLVGIFFIFFSRNYRFPLYKGDVFLIGILLAIILSFFASFEAFLLFKSLANWIIIFTVFLLTRALIKEKQEILKVFDSFIIASIFSCSLILAAYFSGISLNSFISEQTSNEFIQINSASTAYFRGSFFYSNIGYILGMSIFMLTIKFFFEEGIFKKMIYLASSSFLFLTTFVLVEKTALIALAISIIILVLFFLFRYSKNLMFSLISLIFVIFVSIPLISFLFSFFNLDFQIGGFQQRLCVFESSFEVMINNPLSFLFGFGPDSTNILASNPDIRNSLLNCNNHFEGAIDSALVTFIFEYGLFFIIFLYLFFFNTFVNLYKKLKVNYDKNGIIVTLLISIIFININMLGDVLGTSKVTWLVVQIIAIFGIVLSEEKKFENDMNKNLSLNKEG